MIIGLDANEANLANRVGSNQFAYQILLELHKQDKKNTYFIYLKRHPVGDMPKENDNWHYKVISSVPFWTQWRLPLSLYLDKPKPDIFLTLGHYSPRTAPMPTMPIILDLAYLKFPKMFLKKDLKKLTHWTKRSIKKATHIFTISKSTKKDIIKAYQVSDNKISVIYPGTQALKVNPTQKTLKDEYLLYLGTLQPRKNLKELIKAFNSISPDYPKLKLVIIGKKGWLYQPLFDLVEKLNLSDKVKFLGFLPNKKLGAWIKRAKILILPSLYEGFGIPVVQAMKLGTLVLVSRNSSLREIVGPKGLYIQPPFGTKQIQTGIIKAMSITSTQKQELITKGKNRAKDFSFKSATKKILEVINENSF